LGVQRRKPDWTELIHLSVERESETPLFRQLYLELHRLILGSVLPVGSRLPSTRDMSARLRVSRTCVVSAYEQLFAEGYLTARIGSGTYISGDVPKQVETLSPRTPASDLPAARTSMSRYGQQLARHPNLLSQHATRPFNAGRCANDAKTAQVWRQLTLQRLSSFDPVHLGYSDPKGMLELRQAIVVYLQAARAVRCEPEQVVIVSGTHHAFELILKILIDPGDAVWMEDPSYAGLHQALLAANARVVPVPVDQEGLIVSAGVVACRTAKAAFVTPSNQFPLGSVLSMARRKELLAWARREGAWVIEDDYDSEFRYEGRPLAALQGIDDSNRVIYVGTFSKVLFPGLRMGYAVIPPDLLDTFTAARYFSGRNAATLEQGVVTDFINEGHFVSHISRMRQRYREARDVLTEALNKRLGGVLDVEKPEHGLQLLARLPPGLPDCDVAELAAKRGIITQPVSPMFVDAMPFSALLMGFSGYRPDQLRRAVDILANVLEPIQQRQAGDLRGLGRSSASL